MLTLEDLHVARLAREQKLVAGEVLQRFMTEIDAAPGSPGLATRLFEAKLLDAEAGRRIVSFARRRVGLEADKAYTEVALSKKNLDMERLEALMTQTTMGGRIGGKLVAEGLLTPEEDAQIITVAREKLAAQQAELLARERARGFMDESEERKILSEPTVVVRENQVLATPQARPRPQKVAGSGSRGNDAIFSEPTVHLTKEELGADETQKHTTVLPLPNAAPSPDGSTTRKVRKDEPLEPTGMSLALVAPSAGPTGTEVYDPNTKKPLTGKAGPSLAGKTLKVLSGYEIEKELGRGAMGVVYAARETQLKRLVALKVLNASDHPEAAQRFMREARAIAALDHPGIVPVYQYGEADGNYFIAMKLIDGKPLKQVASKPLPAKRAAAILEQVARAMAYAHDQGVVHRDLKPANILIEAGDKAWVVDFGIAKLDTEATLTQAGEIMGTPAYMSPEQSLQMPVTAATDVYSLGAVLYAITTGTPPFPGQNALEVLPRVATEDPPPPRSIRKDLHQDLETIILVAMMKEPERRYASALDLAEDLRRFQAGEPITGQRPSVIYKARRWLRRRMIPLVATALVLTAALGAWTIKGKSAETDKAKLLAEQRAKRAKDLKDKIEGLRVAFDEAQKATAQDVLVAKVKDARELLAAAESLAPEDPQVVSWKEGLEKLVHERAAAKREQAKKSFMEGKGEVAQGQLKEAVALDPESPDNKTLEEFFKRPIMTVRFKAQGAQLAWAKLDADLHRATEWQLPNESTPSTATFAAPETKYVRLRILSPGRMELLLDVEAKPGTTLEVPQAPLETDETRGMAFVAPGPYVLGGKAKGSLRISSPEQVPVAAPGFLVDKTEVTRAAFLAFVNAKGYERKNLWSPEGLAWLAERQAAGPLTGPKDCDLTEAARGNEPVTGVCYYEAEAYARWIGKQLPTHDELELAARGALGGTYPWGNRYAKEFFSVLQSPRAVGTFALDVSPVGCNDLGGNVREWTSTPKKDWATEQGTTTPPHIVKGACFADPEGDALQWAKGAACTSRDVKERAPDLGFRCVRALKPSDF